MKPHLSQRAIIIDFVKPKEIAIRQNFFRIDFVTANTTICNHRKTSAEIYYQSNHKHQQRVLLQETNNEFLKIFDDSKPELQPQRFEYFFDVLWSTTEQHVRPVPCPVL